MEELLHKLLDFFLEIGLPALIFGGIVKLCFLRLEKRMKADEEKREKQEKSRRDYEQYQVKMLTATARLCEANAIALQNGKCNGETHGALENLQRVKTDQRDFLVSQGIDHLFINHD